MHLVPQQRRDGPVQIVDHQRSPVRALRSSAARRPSAARRASARAPAASGRPFDSGRYCRLPKTTSLPTVNARAFTAPRQMPRVAVGVHAHVARNRTPLATPCRRTAGAIGAPPPSNPRIPSFHVTVDRREVTAGRSGDQSASSLSSSGTLPMQALHATRPRVSSPFSSSLQPLHMRSIVRLALRFAINGARRRPAAVR